jgi:hypothetical protein
MFSMFSDDDSLASHGGHNHLAYGTHQVPSFSGPSLDGSESWRQQTTDFTCAVVSQQMILVQFGIELSEAQLVYEATSAGFLSSAGTMPEDMGRLLESHGVSTHQSFGLENLINDLAAGHKVIVAVDSGELWGEDWFIEDYRADHALVVNGLDLSDPNNPQAVLNDPGHPNGAGVRVPLNQFLDAWSDSGQFYVATDEAPPDLANDAVLGSGYSRESGMYMDRSYWERFAEARGVLLGQLDKNINLVSDRLMQDGNLNQAYTAAVVKSITASICSLSNEDRENLLREI